MRVPVLRVDELAPGEHRVVQVGKRSIGVFRVGDEFFALADHCPHQGGPLCRGRVAAAPTSGLPGEFGMADGAFVACPWHGWEYDVTTGQSYFGPGEAPVRSYPVSVEPAAAHPAAAHPTTGRLPGPYVADTYDVAIEDRYVVIDTAGRRTRADDEGDGR
ncbi:Rieske (2Fe-2S) protein [Pseudonocardia sp. KRD291]|uniref:Rieske (2Fe-2S) protein n=1 Tax=Pseudonocardia sp. KRD291 TaxID=2792007 RepID=UPI001C4A48DC|nr:Rieske (2Fe-2S) protein [Pseudonocardia sp. KRD291]